MRKRFFIILPIFVISLFLVIDYLVSSAEHSFLSINRNQAYNPDKKPEGVPPDSFSANKMDNQNGSGKEIAQKKLFIKSDYSISDSSSQLIGGEIRYSTESLFF